MASQVPPRANYQPNGASVAAVVAATFGLFVLGFVVLLTEVNAGVNQAVFKVGKTWIPGAAGIGPYSGKETFMLLGWLGSWVVLHLGLRNREVDTKAWFGGALVFLLLGTLLVWPPVWEVLKTG